MILNLINLKIMEELKVITKEMEKKCIIIKTNKNETI